MSLKYEPSSEPLHIPAKFLFLNVSCRVQLATGPKMRSSRSMTSLSDANDADVAETGQGDQSRTNDFEDEEVILSETCGS